MTVLTFVWLVVGLILLVAGAEFLVRGSSDLAANFGISPLVIGLTVVAFGTSAPELAVSLNAGWQGHADIALGNVVGSNICNVLLILGVSALIVPLTVAPQLVRLDVPIMIGVSLLLLLFGLDGQIGRSDGAVMFLGGLVYTVFLLYQSHRQQKHPEQTRPEQILALHDDHAKASSTDARPTDARPTGTRLRAESSTAFPVDPGLINLGFVVSAGFIVSGLAMLVAGSQMLVSSAVEIATFFGVSSLIIGLTVIALGTSLPELATSVMASIRGERDIAIGNVIGSNIFNILVVLGLTAVASPTGVMVSTLAQSFDVPIMVAVAVMCLPIFFSGNEVSRSEGAFFFVYYGLYISYSIANATNPGAPWVGWLHIVLLPLTLFIIGLLGWHAWVTRKRRLSV